jgi:hypothetical protein
MDAANLIAYSMLETGGWLPVSPPIGRPHIARSAQDRLVALTKAAMGQRSNGHAEATRPLLNLLLDAVNDISMDVVRQVPAALRAVHASGAKYLMEYDPIGEDVFYAELSFDDLTLLNVTLNGFDWLQSARDLPPTQQMLVYRWIISTIDLKNVRVHEKIAQESRNSRELKRISKEVAELTKNIAALEQSLGGKGRKIGNDFFEKIETRDLAIYPIVLAVIPGVRQFKLSSFAKLFERAGSQLIQPLPFYDSIRGKRLRSGKLAWEKVNELGSTLHVLAIWVRALETYKQPKICTLCYRHLADHAKIFCCEHRRKDGARQSQREFHIASLYRETLVDLNLQTNESISGGSASKTEVGMGLLPMWEKDAKELPAELKNPALKLRELLSDLSPIFGPELTDKVLAAYSRTIHIALKPFGADIPPTQEKAFHKTANQAHAIRWLNWHSFLRGWYSETFDAPWNDGSSISGMAFDLDHPFAKGEPVGDEYIKLDLIRQRAWTGATAKLDDSGYIRVHGIMKMSKDGYSLRAIAKAFGVSHEAVRKTIQYANSGGASPERRQRVTATAKKTLLKG